MEKSYKRTVNLIAVLMIIQFCLWFAASFVYVNVNAIISSHFAPVAAEVLGELAFALFYSISFGIPILLGRRFLGTGEQIRFNIRLGAFSVPMICASLGIIFASAIVNNLVTRPFDSIGLDVYTIDTSMTVTPMTFLAHILSLVIIPAVLEELLFRGVILGALLPYGKTGAVFISALLFAMMHQNPKQFIYAFAAGAVIAYFVLETHSVFMGMLIHGVNNFLSLVNMAVMNASGEKTVAAYSLSLYFAVFVLALISIPVLIGRIKKEEASTEKTTTVKQFFTPAMIIYFVISVLYFVFMIMS